MIIRNVELKVNSYILFVFLILLSNVLSCKYIVKIEGEQANENSLQDSINKINYITDFKPVNDNGNINVIVEIPAGTIEKWEVDKIYGKLILENVNDSPRKINYLGYPGNYGMVPKSLLPLETGGDGDPLDVILLGPAVARGSLIEAKLIGVIKLLDNGERDDKLIAVFPGSPLNNVNTLKELNNEYSGIIDILEIWFLNYKGAGQIQIEGIEDEKEAKEILTTAINEYKEYYE
ncbi:MAG: inorganic diphosphatase [Bacteroidales bacterium]|nr:inorganic diphosphatase [Bacteroidales bacterium]